jgi:UDP-N-acetyl-2-amino-2-deoxyglucuronate dehydrogenase
MCAGTLFCNPSPSAAAGGRSDVFTVKVSVMSEDLRVGIIGCGVISATHIESYQDIPGIDVRWACDIVPERAAKRAQQYGIVRQTTDYHDLLADPELAAVSVCTDHASHAEIVIEALSAGKHVLCEKALATTTEDLDGMLAAHAANDQLVFAGVFQHRFEGVNRVLRQLVEDGAFGQPLTATMQVHCLRPDSYYRDNWHGTLAREGGSVLINQSIHFVDALAWIMGGVQSVSATMANLDHQGVIETEDTLTATVRFAGGALGTLEATSASHLNWEHAMAIHGTEGSIEMRNNKPAKISFTDDQLARRVERLLATADDPEGVAGAASHYGTGHKAQIADFIDAIRTGRAPFVTGADAACANRIVLAAYQSAKEERWVDVPA